MIYLIAAPIIIPMPIFMHPSHGGAQAPVWLMAGLLTVMLGALVYLFLAAGDILWDWWDLEPVNTAVVTMSVSTILAVVVSSVWYLCTV